MALKRNYYYLVAGLPDLLLDESRLKTSLATIRSEFENELHPDDLQLFRMLFLKHDHFNLTNFLKKKFHVYSEKGNFNREYLEEQIKNPDESIPPYMVEFILKFRSSERANPGATWESELEYDFINWVEENVSNEFLLNWFRFFHDFRNVNTALVSRRHKIAAEPEIVAYNHIAHTLLRSNARDFGISQDFPEVEKIIAAWDAPNLLEREMQLDQIKWQWIDENTFFDYFTIEKLLGFTLQLEMADRWMSLDPEKGKTLFYQLVTSLGKQYTLPEEFNPQHIKRK
jgi:hypothetical protein